MQSIWLTLLWAHNVPSKLKHTPLEAWVSICDICAAAGWSFAIRLWQILYLIFSCYKHGSCLCKRSFDFYMDSISWEPLCGSDVGPNPVSGYYTAGENYPCYLAAQLDSYAQNACLYRGPGSDGLLLHRFTQPRPLVRSSQQSNRWLVQLHLGILIKLQGLVHPTMKIVLVITHPHVVTFL